MEDAALIPYIDADQLADALKINLGDISESLADQTSKFVYYASQAVRARRQYERWKTALEVLEAQLDARFRKDMIEEVADAKGNTKTKGPTEPQIRAAIVNDPKWKAVSSRVIDAQEIYKLVDVVERGFEHRREMLKQIAQDQAREAGGQLRVLANQDAKSKADTLLKTMADKKQASQP